MKEEQTEENDKACCKYCGNTHTRKYGYYKGEQKYYCRDCKKTFTMSNTDKRIKHSITLRKLTISLYLSGTSMRGIQRVLNTCHNAKIYIRTITCWIKNANSILEQEKERRKETIFKNGEKTTIPIVEMDELYTYVKKNQKIQKQEEHILTNEYGLLWIGAKVKLLRLR